LLETELLTHAQIQTALFGSGSFEQNASSTESPKFQTGQAVRVSTFDPSTSVAWKRPHIRTPGYIYGVAGVIERVCGTHPDPFLAFGWEAPLVQLYIVRFRQCDIWPEQYDSNADQGTRGGGSEGKDDNGDVVEVEIYEHWLQPTEESSGHAYATMQLLDHSDSYAEGDQDCVLGHAHSHSHDHEHGDRSHDSRLHVEERAVRLEGPPRPGQELHKALLQLLLQEQIVTSDEMRAMMERLDTAGRRLLGADLVVQAWLDDAFRERLIQDAASAALEIGISASNANAPTVLTVVPNTPQVHNLIVCTLCSCYPAPLLGLAPSWYKSREYRSRAVREPRRVLEQDFGSIPDIYGLAQKQIRVHDSTADHRYMVLPERPSGTTEDWTAEQLRSIVTRDCMLGVAVTMIL
jgi:hypothetical protein